MLGGGLSLPENWERILLLKYKKKMGITRPGEPSSYP